MKVTEMRITTPVWGEDAKLFIGIINQGIDSRLEAFTKSKFELIIGRRYAFNFHEDEYQILLRRLGDSEWVDDLVMEIYGVEL